MSGYLISCHKIITIDYCENKIINTLTKLFGWIIFFSVLNYIFNGVLLNPFEQVILSLQAKGILPVAWFIFTYCIILITASFLFRVSKAYPISFSIISSLIILALALGFAHRINNKAQGLWFHIYLGYFVFGIATQTIKDLLDNIMDRRQQNILFLLTFILSSLYFYIQIATQDKFSLPETYYGKWYYSIWLLSIFYIMCNIDIKSITLKKLIVLLSKNSFSVYLAHLPILTFITNKYHALNSVIDCFIMLFLLFIFLQTMSEVLKKLPLLRKLI